MVSAERAVDFAATIGFRFGKEAFTAWLQHGSLAVRRAEPERVAVTVLSDPPTIASIVDGARPTADMVARQTLRIEGDPAVPERFTTLSPLPPKATAARDRNDPSHPSTSPSSPSLSARHRRGPRGAIR